MERTIKKIHVLLADDHPIVRVGVRTLVNSEPDMKVVGEASTGLEAVNLTRELQPDVVVMDITMPEIDGLEATRRIHEAQPETQVLILTIHAHERYLFPVLKAGAAGYVLKSTVDTELINAIRSVAQGEVFLYPSATQMVLKDYVTRLHRGEEQDAYDRLSDREREVLRLIALGHTTSEIAEKLILSPKSVETYRTRIMRKLNLHSRSALVRFALSRGLLNEETR